jgi:L-lactate dehydrogenase complex protein LldG
MDARQQILSSIREALKTPTHLPDETPRDQLQQAMAFGHPSLEEKIQAFKAELKSVSAECIEVASETEIPEKIEAILKEASTKEVSVSGGAIIDRIGSALTERGIRVVRPETLAQETRKNDIAKIIVGVVEAPYAIADTATLVVPMNGRSTQPHYLPETVIALVSANTLFSNHFEMFSKIAPEERKNMVLITGPSRTADIEKILILGAHGPGRVVVCLIP